MHLEGDIKVGELDINLEQIFINWSQNFLEKIENKEITS